MKTMLTISHYIYLTKEERYKLFERIPTDTIGVNVPVWFNKGDTSEPAKEIFCRYYITNNTDSKAIIPTLEGYTINLPQKFINFQVDESSALRLLDVKDKGCEELVFRQYAKLTKDNKSYNVVHFIEIKPIETLLESLVQ